jgi:carboxyl-terminal processing protease
MINHIKDYALRVIIIVSLFTAACKKDKKEGESNSKQTSTTNRRDLTNDSLFLYAKQIYYWNSTLPSYDNFEPRKYTNLSTDLANYENNLLNIGKAAAAADYEVGESSLKYSYIEDITTRNPVSSLRPNSKSSVDLEGNGSDIGIRPVFYLISSTNRSYALFVTAVYKGSDADKKGVKRGWRITKINGTAIGGNYENERSTVISALSAASVNLEGTKYVTGEASGTFSVTLNKTNYKSSPVYFSRTFTAGTKKIGYLAYARFSSESNSIAVLDTVFRGFADGGVTDLIIDLRYNGGGYVSTAQHLINLIAPAGTTGVMYKEYYNATLRDGKATIMKNQPILDDNDKLQYENGKLVNYFDNVDYSVAKNTENFEKAGNLNAIQNVVFIVSGNTASASELVINCLKPKMNVKLVGEQTYGKPVGFFPIRLEGKYDVLFALFETKNSLDQGGYFSGMIPEYAESAAEPNFFDDPTYDFGEIAEPYTAKAIKVLNPSNAQVSVKSRAVMSIGGKAVSLNNQNELKPLKENDEFKGMIETRHKDKK